MSPLDKFEKARRDRDFVIVAFFRGSWCPFCKAWLQEWSNIKNLALELRSINAVLLMVSSQSQSEVTTTLTNWNVLTSELKSAGVKGIGDPKNTIAEKLRFEKYVEILISGSPGPYTKKGMTYPHGMAQTACVAFQKGKKTPIYDWATIPTPLNLDGAINRPSPQEIWSYLMTKRGEINSVKKSKIRKPKGETMRYIVRLFSCGN
eukprot:g3123.t1